MEDEEYQGTFTGFMQSQVLGFCELGNQEDNLFYIKEGLSLINEINDYASLDEVERKTWLESWHLRNQQHHGNTVIRDFFWYWCESNELTENNGALTGWLNQNGLDLLDMLTEWRNTICN